LDEAVMGGFVDLAVHSLKDVPSERPEGLVLGAVLPREDPRDAVVGDLKEGATVGTSSPRRKALLLSRRSDLHIVEFRGNVDTRLAKIAAGEVDATLLAMAGLKRIGRADAADRILDADEFLPAACQGAIGVECRVEDDSLRALLGKVNHRESEI